MKRSLFTLGKRSIIAGIITLAIALEASCVGTPYPGAPGTPGATSGNTLTSIQISPAGGTISVGDTLVFTATGKYADGSSTDITPNVIWSSSNPAVAAINSRAIATGVAPGAASITANYGSITSPAVTVTVTSSALPASSSRSPAANVTLISIAVTPANWSLAAGAGLHYTAYGTYSDNSSQEITSKVTWASSNPAIATIDASGGATAVAAGTAVITASLGSITSNAAALTVTGGTVTLVSLVITPAPTDNLAVGGDEFYSCKATYSDGTNADVTEKVTWVSSNPGIATVDPTGDVTAVAAGTTSITASLSGVTGPATKLTVTPSALSNPSGQGKTVVSLRIAVASGFSATMSAGQTCLFDIFATYSDGTTVENSEIVSADWVSSNPNVADGIQGEMDALAPGTTQVTAKLGSVTSNAVTLTVK